MDSFFVRYELIPTKLFTIVFIWWYSSFYWGVSCSITGILGSQLASCDFISPGVCSSMARNLGSMCQVVHSQPLYSFNYGQQMLPVFDGSLLYRNVSTGSNLLSPNQGDDANIDIWNCGAFSSDWRSPCSMVDLDPSHASGSRSIVIMLGKFHVPILGSFSRAH